MKKSKVMLTFDGLSKNVKKYNFYSKYTTLIWCNMLKALEEWMGNNWSEIVSKAFFTQKEHNSFPVVRQISLIRRK